jgi:hypothetical protein
MNTSASSNRRLSIASLFDGSIEQLRFQGGYGVEGGIAQGLGGAIGTGRFDSGASYSVGSTPYSVSTGDFNGDGVLDLVTADYGSDTTSVMLGLGNGTFAPRVSYSVGGNPHSVSTVRLVAHANSSLIG